MRLGLKHGDRFVKKAGGAPANVAAAINRMRPSQAAKVGHDAVGDFLLHTLESEVIEHAGVTRCDFQQTFLLNAFQQVNEMTGFQLSYRQVSSHGQDMIVHTRKQTGRVVL
ncbi:hypothetical protein HBB05_15985 [Pantoea agglomerans]|nr:hypothetical protein [Pantoea agglomerans]TRO77356.1 hypothetical protein E5140_03315 [Pantoea agglomerans]